MSHSPAIPVHEIDLAPFVDGSPLGRQAVADELDRAGRDSGFILLRGHDVPQKIVDDAHDAWQTFFDLPLEEKMRSMAPPELAGYIGYLAEAFSVCRKDHRVVLRRAPGVVPAERLACRSRTQLARNAFEIAWLTPRARDSLLDELDRYLAGFVLTA